MTTLNVGSVWADVVAGFVALVGGFLIVAVLAISLGFTGLLIAVPLWHALLAYGLVRWATARGPGVLIGAVLIAVAIVVILITGN